jgi:hypothetical protein
MLLQLSVAHQLTYLLSIVEQADCVIPASVKDFDQAMDATLAEIAAVPAEHPHLSTIRCLPSSMGGLGLHYGWSMLLDLQKRQWIISAPPSSNCIYNDDYSLSLCTSAESPRRSYMVLCI